MLSDCPAPFSRQARLRALRPFWVVFLLFEGTVFLLRNHEPAKNSALAYAFAIGMSLSFSAMIVILARVTLRQRDEFQRKLLMEAMLWSIGATLVLTTVWGCLEVFTNAPHLTVLWNFPIFIVIMATVKVTLFRRNRAGTE
jgi:hypothetical protein